MAEFPTYEEMAKNIAEKALDDFLYNGKSIREWMQIIASEDCISRKRLKECFHRNVAGADAFDTIIDMQPSIQPKPKTDVLDKIRAEIAEYGSIMVAYAITKDTKTDKGIEKLVSGVLKQAKEQVLEIIDKYKAESEDKG